MKNGTAAAAEQKKQFSKLVTAISTGRAPVLEAMLRKAGYTPGGIDPESMTATQLSRLFGVTAQAVGLWHKKQGCPRKHDGTYRLHEVLAWKEQKHKEELELVSEDALLLGDGKSDPTLCALRKVKTERERFELNIKKKDYVLAADVLHHWRQLGTMIGRAIETLDRRFPDAATIVRDNISSFELKPNDQEESAE